MKIYELRAMAISMFFDFRIWIEYCWDRFSAEDFESWETSDIESCSGTEFSRFSRSSKIFFPSEITVIRALNYEIEIKIDIYHEDLEKRGRSGVVAHKRHENYVSQ